MFNLLFLTTTNFATNPRVVKEIKLALQLGYQVEVVCFTFNNWSDKFSEQVYHSLEQRLVVHQVSATHNPFLPWVFTTLLQKIAKFLLKVKLVNPFLVAQALDKRNWLLIRKLKNLQISPSLIIAHNPGSFYAAMKWAKTCNCHFAIDVEDYHPGEFTDKDTIYGMMKMMQLVLPKAEYVSFAAPLIQAECLKNMHVKQSVTILNYFPRNEFLQPAAITEERIQAVWFSQYISYGRGLETLLKIAPAFAGKIDFYLFGTANQEFVADYLVESSNTHILPPVSQEKLHHSLAMFDLGLALEDKEANYNRQICITNKILSYYQAGLYILASETSAQLQFINDNSAHGTVISLSESELIMALENIVKHRDIIRAEKFKRYELVRQHSSETELTKVSDIWQKLAAAG